jgi:hypothetical protein
MRYGLPTTALVTGLVLSVGIATADARSASSCCWTCIGVGPIPSCGMRCGPICGDSARSGSTALHKSLTSTPTKSSGSGAPAHSSHKH